MEQEMRSQFNRLIVDLKNDPLYVKFHSPPITPETRREYEEKIYPRIQAAADKIKLWDSIHGDPRWDKK